MYALSTLPKRTTPLIEHSSGKYLSPALARHNMISAILRFYDDMRACVRLGDRVYSGRFVVEQDLRQGCVLAPLLFNIFFAAAVNNVVYMSLKADKKTSSMLWCI